MPDMYTAIGLMSGTSLDGIDAAVIRTDGAFVEQTAGGLTVPYERDDKALIRAVIAGEGDEKALALRLTELHALVVEQLMAQEGLEKKDVDVIGFHGQTVLHAPERGVTRQLGDGDLLARLTGIDVVCDLRSADMRVGGQGAPLVPLYHHALVQGEPLPVVVANIGGLANITYIDHAGVACAFDTGPGNGLLDDWVQVCSGLAYDEGGEISAKGAVDVARLEALLAHDFFDKKPPKSLDRADFDLEMVQGLSVEDGGATLVEFTAATLAESQRFLPGKPLRWLISGGGRHNKLLMQRLAALLSCPVEPIEALGHNGDLLEAEAFAFLAVRSRKGMPTSDPAITGARQAAVGGVFCPA